ncbi:AraC family transcriptional regulator [Paenibacillus silvisoli]|uniref:AraC family transcriptional regulator n=1 Tax=Paenibacillus silvisoli TaxID=3110539 RepID=UPI0028051EB0|nr:AraC family transcriptional regulator [Paenibacillus silvisoli]
MKKADGFEAEKINVLPPFLIDEMAAHPLIKQLYMTDIGFFPRARHHYRERPSGCDTHILIYCSSGEGWIKKGSEAEFRLTEKSLTVIPANTSHAYGADDQNPWSIYWFHLKGDMADAFIQHLNLASGPVKLSLSDSDKFIALFDQCYDALLEKSYSLDHLVHISQTIGYLLSYVGIRKGQTEDEKAVRYIEQAVHYMRERLESNLSLDELAVHVSLSKQHLNHVFKQSTGFAPIDYYLRMKIQRAGQLLDLTERSMKDICLSLGFKDPYYFSRLFKKMIGMSPTEYRNKLKG